VDCELDAGSEVYGPLPRNFDGFLDVFDFCNVAKTNLSERARPELVEVLGFGLEETAEHVFGPLDAVKCLFWEQFEGAVRNLVVFLRVFRRAIRLSLVGNDHLNMTLGSQGATVQKGHSCIDAFLVDEEASCDVVEGVCYDCLRFEELLGVDMLCVLV